jgi:hypothetical protein
MIVERAGKLYTRFMGRFSNEAPFALALALLVVALLAMRYVPRPSPPAPAGPLDDVDPAQVVAVEATWGLRITNVAVTAAGGLIDFRFQVIDPDKALGIHDPEGLPVLIDEASGLALLEPGVHGDHAVRGYRAGGTYYLLYQNNNGLLKPGSRITIRIGDLLLENVLVR